MHGSAWVQESGEKLMGRCMVGTEWCTNHGKKAVEPVCICRDFVIWHGVHGVDWVKPMTALHTDIPMVHKTPLGTGMGCACLRGQHGVWFLVLAGASWGRAKTVVDLANFSPCQ